MLSAIFEQFAEASPVSVMARGLMERVFAKERMDLLFETHAQQQYQQDLLFSSQVELMSLVVCGIQKAVHAANPCQGSELEREYDSTVQQAARDRTRCESGTRAGNGKRVANAS